MTLTFVRLSDACGQFAAVADAITAAATAATRDTEDRAIFRGWERRQARSC